MEPRNILIVDDDADLRDSLKAILEGAGYVVTTAASRSEGMEKMGVLRHRLPIACLQGGAPGG